MTWLPMPACELPQQDDEATGRFLLARSPQRPPTPPTSPSRLFPAPQLSLKNGCRADILREEWRRCRYDAETAGWRGAFRAKVARGRESMSS